MAFCYDGGRKMIHWKETEHWEYTPERKKVIVPAHDEYAGRVLAIGSKTVQIMSDVWEDTTAATVWDGTTVKVVNLWTSGIAEIDATEETWSEVRKWYFDRQLAEITFQARQEALNPTFGNKKVKVLKGKDKTVIGKIGDVFAAINSEYKAAWKTTSMKKLGVRFSDEKIAVAKNGKVFQNWKDVVWIWPHNVEVVNPDQYMPPVVELEQSAAAQTNSYIAKMRDPRHRWL
jgi:hypothetical protein